MPDIVIIIPGITGSVLRKDGKDLWALSGGAFALGLRTLGKSIQSLALIDDPPDVDDLGDGVTAVGLMPDLHLLPGLWPLVDGYTGITRTLGKALGLQPGADYHLFPYDWRRDNRVAARRLAQCSHDWLAARRKDYPAARLILIAHSMGGLVARYFLECLDGWRDTRLLITFGTPYRGALNALDFLANGLRKHAGPMPLLDLSDIVRSFTSVYQLLPIYPCLEQPDGLVRVSEAERIPGVEPSKAMAADAYHREIERAVEEHLQDEEYRTSGYQVRPIVGVRQPTFQSARQVAGHVEMFRTYQGRDLDGDGTVPRVSAVPLELSNKNEEMAVAERHGTLQSSTTVLTQVIAALTATQIDFTAFRVQASRGLSLDVDDYYTADERVVVRASLPGGAADPVAQLHEATTGALHGRYALGRVQDGSWQRVLPPLPAGAYRLTVTATDATPVTALFAVFPDESTLRPARTPDARSR
jgi:hypothetical protein